MMENPFYRYWLWIRLGSTAIRGQKKKTYLKTRWQTLKNLPPICSKYNKRGAGNHSVAVKAGTRQWMKKIYIQRQDAAELSDRKIRGEEKGIKICLRQHFISYGDNNIPDRWNKGFPLLTQLFTRRGGRGLSLSKASSKKASTAPAHPDHLPSGSFTSCAGDSTIYVLVNL